MKNINQQSTVLQFYTNTSLLKEHYRHLKYCISLLKRYSLHLCLVLHTVKVPENFEVILEKTVVVSASVSKTNKKNWNISATQTFPLSTFISHYFQILKPTVSFKISRKKKQSNSISSNYIINITDQHWHNWHQRGFTN